MQTSTFMVLPDPQTPETTGNLRRGKTAPKTTPGGGQPAPKTTPGGGPVASFTYKGRRYRIFKRYNKPDSKWYLYFEHKKNRHKYSLGAVDKKSAEASAKIKIDSILVGNLVTLRASLERQPDPEPCTIGQLLATYDRTPLEISATTRSSAHNCLKNFLRRALGQDTDVEKLSAKVLTAETVRLYFENALRLAQAQPDQVAIARKKRTANSILNQARTLFVPKLLAAYRRADLVLPDLEPFLAAYDEEKFSGTTSVAYHPPSEATIRATLRAWLSLTDRNEFLAVGLELSCGLRKAEVAQVTWGMFTRSMGSPLLDGRGWVKNLTGAFVVPPIDPFWRLLNRRIAQRKWRGKDDELVLTGHLTERTDETFRRISHWMRSLGWETQKTNHAFRAYSGALIAMKFGIYRASAWLRHSSIKVTENHYSHFVGARVFTPEKIRIRWAK